MTDLQQSPRQNLPYLPGEVDHSFAHPTEVLGGGDQALDADVVPAGARLFLIASTR